MRWWGRPGRLSRCSVNQKPWQTLAIARHATRDWASTAVGISRSSFSIAGALTADPNLVRNSFGTTDADSETFDDGQPGTFRHLCKQRANESRILFGMIPERKRRIRPAAARPRRWSEQPLHARRERRYLVIGRIPPSSSTSHRLGPVPGSGFAGGGSCVGRRSSPDPRRSGLSVRRRCASPALRSSGLSPGR